jgi:hypothetical protein
LWQRQLLALLKVQQKSLLVWRKLPHNKQLLLGKQCGLLGCREMPRTLSASTLGTR